MDEDQEEGNEILSNMIVIGVSFVVITAVVVLVVVDVDSPKKTRTPDEQRRHPHEP